VFGGLLKVAREERRQARNGRKLIAPDECAEPDFADTKCLCKLAGCELDLPLDGFDDLLWRAISRHVISLVNVVAGPAIR
jgi:hypothetical protein